MKNCYSDRIKTLQALMKTHNIDIYLVTDSDFHSSEYISDYFKFREYLSGFTGSNGQLVVTQNSAHLFTDGRYFIQAENELKGSDITLQKMGEKGVPTILEFLEKCCEDANECVSKNVETETKTQNNIQKNSNHKVTLAYDGRTVSTSLSNEIHGKLKKFPNINIIENLDFSLVIWQDRPEFTQNPIWELDTKFAGKSREMKIDDVRRELKKLNADYLLLASLDDIAWLFNLRGSDIPYNPVFMSYALISEDNAVLYLNPACLDGELSEKLAWDKIAIKPYFDIYSDLPNLKSCSILLDESTINTALLNLISKSVKIINRTSPVAIFKSQKNPTEISNIKKAHIKDGVAVTKLIFWLKNMPSDEIFPKGNLTELDVANRLLELRKSEEGFIEQSFAPIVASGANGAIVHYEPTKENNSHIELDNFTLIDTGGQYFEGTTDITRTVALGTLTEEQKTLYTAVLRGNLNLANAKFRHGTTGVNLDILARSPLYELGFDFEHGTGHGVGYLLNVHEGPQSFRRRDKNGGAVFEAGMLTSNEPGVYLEGKYGIRLENLMLCEEFDAYKNSDLSKIVDPENELHLLKNNINSNFLHFKTVTLAPFERDAILPEMMTDRELSLLNSYHKMVRESLSPYLTESERKWLEEVTAEIRK